jgi:hypothetical protein
MIPSKPLGSEFHVRQLAKLKIPKISAPAYRTYHPDALREGWPDTFERIASSIISDFISSMPRSS